MPSSCPQSIIRIHATVPGILRETIERRWSEFGYPGFSPFALELICFDMRKRRDHLITRAFAVETASVQDALDRELVRQYVPGKKKRGLLMQALFCEIRDTGHAPIRGTYAAYRAHVHYSEVL